MVRNLVAVLRFTRHCVIAAAGGAIAILAAADAGAAKDRCALQPSESRSVVAVTDSRSIRVHDGTEIYLHGILPPSPTDLGTASRTWASEHRARQTLEQIVQGQTVAIARTLRATDRYGRVRAHLFVREGSGVNGWLQAQLVRRGAARVDISGLSPPCAKLLLALEDYARENRIGLWSEAAYDIKSAEQPRALLRFRGTFQLVEGRVFGIARIKNRVFINFAEDWRKDFTIGLSRKTARMLAESGLDLDALKGRTVRVRGWIESRGGPFIYLKSREQLQVLPEAPRPANEDRARPFPSNLLPDATSPESGAPLQNGARSPKPDGAPGIGTENRPALDASGGLGI
jgi:micrococcal nuclease